MNTYICHEGRKEHNTGNTHKKLIRRWDTRMWHQCHTLRCISINSTHYCSQ